MEEKFVRSRLYHHLACRRTDASTNLWHVDDFLSHALAILYPYVRDGIIDTEEKLGLLIQAIRTFRKSAKEKLFLDSLTELSLIDVIKNHWIVKIENKIEIASSLLLVDSIDETEQVHVKQQLLETYIRLSIPGSNMNYGCVEYVCAPESDKEELEIQKSEEVSNCDNEETIIITPKKEKQKSQYIPTSQEEQNLIEMWQVEKFPTSLSLGDFFWQYKISEKQYTKIKEALISLNFSDKNAKFIRKYAFKISFFLAEWFKREYDGYQNERGLSIIGIDSQQSRRIWEDSQFPDCYLINSGQNEYLFSIYVLGGFPINYIRRVRRFDSLFRNIWNLKQGEDIDEELLEDISESFETNNTVYQESLHKGGSLYAYIEDLVDDCVPISQEDINLEPYRTFCEMLSEGKRACYDNYLSCIWNIYTDEISEEVEAFVNIKVGTYKNRCYIPYECVCSWIGSQNPDEFVLGLETQMGKKSENTIRFSRSGKSYVGWGNTSVLSMMFDIQEDLAIKVLLYSVDDLERTKGKQVQHSFAFPNSCQLYQTRTPYKWSSIKDTKSRSAVFFNAHRYQITEGKEYSCYLIPAHDGKQSWVWTRVYDLVTLVDIETSEEISYNSKQGAMNVFFSKHKGVRYNQYDEVTHVYALDDDTMQSESVPLILGIKGIRRVKLYPFEANESPQKITAYKAFYKQDSWNYLPFDEQNQPKCGMIQLKIVYKDYKPIIKKCFFLPQPEILKRRIESRKIQFFSTGINMWKPIGDNYVLMDDKEVFDNESFNSVEDVIPFRIGEETDYITLDVYRADNCREIYFENRCLSRKKGSIIDIPLILKHKFYIRTIDDSGVKRTEPGANVMLDYSSFSNIWNIARLSKTVKEDGIRYYLYTFKHKQEIGRYALQISIKQKDNYQFYYWSGELDDAPVKLTTNFDKNLNCLIVPLDKLEGKSQGIIFQSLKETTPPNYVVPYYPKNINWQYLADRMYNDDMIVKAMRVAAEHHVYFSQFYQLHRLFHAYDNGKELVNVVIKYLRIFNKKEDFLSMHRFANEFSFEWIALPWINWTKACKTEQDKIIVEKLFRSNPRIVSPIEKTSLDLILERYWSLPRPQYWNFQRKKNIEAKTIENIVMQSMRGVDKDYSFFARRSKSGILTYPTDNVYILNEIFSSDSFYRKLQKEIFEKIINK